MQLPQGHRLDSLIGPGPSSVGSGGDRNGGRTQPSWIRRPIQVGGSGGAGPNQSVKRSKQWRGSQRTVMVHFCLQLSE